MLYLQPGFFCLGFVPVVDGDILPDVPRAMRMRGEYKKVPFMNGMTKDDGALYTVGCRCFYQFITKVEISDY